MLKKSTIVAIAGSLIVGGIGLSAVGLVLGGRSSVEFDSFLELGEPSFAEAYTVQASELEAELGEVMDTVVNLETGEVTQTGWEKLEAFTNLKVEVGTVDFNIIQGEEYKIELDIKSHVDLTYNIKGDTLYVKQKNIDKYGLGDSFRNNMNDGKITVMIPEDITLDKVILNLGVGESLVENIKAHQLQINNGVGSMVINNVVAEDAHITGGVGDTYVEGLMTEKVIFDSGVGSVNASGLVSKSLEANMGVGDIYIQGDVQGDIEATGGLGELKLELEGKEKDYNYIISRGGGDITINGMNQFGLGDVKFDNGGKYDIEIEAGLGEIVIKTEN